MRNSETNRSTTNSFSDQLPIININTPQLELQPTLPLKKKLQEAYSKNDKLPKIVDDEDIPEQKLKNTYVNLMLIKREGRKEAKPGDNQKEQDKKDESKRNDYEDIVASKEEIELEKIFEIKRSDKKDGKEQAKEKPKSKVLIYGRAGVGKTTLCQYISYKWAKKDLWQDKFDYLFVLPLRNLNSTWKQDLYPIEPISNLLESFIDYSHFKTGETIGKLKRILNENKILLILDGYDEIAHKHNDPIVKQILNKVIENKNENIKVIMTSRPNAVRNDIRQKFKEIENIGLKEENIYKYIDNYFPETEEGKLHKKNISEFIKKSNQIREVVRTPINLYLLCLIWKKESKLQNQIDITLTNLYERITRWLMKRYLHKYREQDLFLIRDEEVEKVCTKENVILERIAFKGMQKHQIIISKELIKEAGIDGKDLEAMKGLGLFTAIGKEKKVIDKNHEFIHLTFQEYLGAKYISKVLKGKDEKAIKEIVKFIEEIKFERFYERMIFFLSGIVNKEGGQAQKYFWHIILNGNFALTINQQMLLLFRCLNEVEGKQIIAEYKKLGKLLGSYLQEGIDKFYKGTFEEICNYGRAVNILITEKYLKLEEVKISVNNLDNLIVLAVINNIARRRIMVKLLPLLKDEYPDVRRSVASTIGKIVKVRPEIIDEEVIKELLPLLKDEDKYVRRSVADAIAEIVKVRPEVIKELLPLLKDKDEDSNVRSRVADAIAEIVKVRPEVIKELLPLLKDKDEDSNVRSRVADAIAEIVKVRPEVIKELLPLLKDEDKYVRRSVADAIVEIVKVRPEVIEELLPLLKDEDKYVRRSVADAIGEVTKVRPEIINEEVIKELLTLLKDKDVSSSVAKTIGNIAEAKSEIISNKVVKKLFSLIRDKDYVVESSAGKAIVSIARVRPEVISEKIVRKLLLDDEERYIRNNSTPFLMASNVKPRKLVDEKVIKKLLLLLKDTLFPLLKDKDVSSSVAGAIGNIAKVKPEVISEEIIAELLLLLKKGDWYVKSRVAETIGKITKAKPEVVSEEIITELLTLLKDKDVSNSVVEAIGNIAKVKPEVISEKVISELISILKEGSFIRGNFAAGAIGNIAEAKPEVMSEEVVKELFSLLGHENNWQVRERIRSSLIEAIGNIAKVKPEVISEEIITELLLLLKKGDRRIRSSVVGAIGNIAKAKFEVIERLLPLLKGKDWGARSSVLEVIDKIAKVKPEVISEEIITELLLLIRNKDCFVKRKHVRSKYDERRSIVDILDNIAKVKPEVINGEAIEKLLFLCKDEDQGIGNRIEDIINHLPLKYLLTAYINASSLLKLEELIEILSKTLIILDLQGIYYNENKLIPFNQNNDYKKFQATKAIFNAFYKYHVQYSLLSTIFFESAYNYKKLFEIKGIELIEDIIPNNSYLEQSSRSLIDNQYDKLSALNWAISIVCKARSVSNNERCVFMVLEGKSIFYTSILHRIEFVIETSILGEILINSRIHVKNEELSTIFHELLGDPDRSKVVKLEKGKDYQAHTFLISSEKADKLYEEALKEKELFLTKAEQVVGKENQTKKQNSFTWAKDKLERYLDKEELKKLKNTNWSIFKIVGGEMKEGMVAALELIEVKAENYNVLAINQNLVEYSKLLYEICEGKQNLNILSKYKEDSDTLILIAAMSLHPIDQSMVVKRNEIINTLCNQKIGLAAKDDMGNTVAYYAARHNERRVLKVLIDNGYYTKEVTNNAGANVLHTAVYYKSVDMLLDVLKGERNLDFSKQVKIGDKEFAPLELAVALGDIREMEKLWGINKRLKAVSSWCEKNLLNVAIEFKREDVLHYLLHTDKYTCSWEDVQNAYIYAGKVGNVGAMQVIEKAFRLEKYKEASQSGQNIEDNENTALHKAIEYEQIEVIKFLMRQRDITLTHIRNKDNKKPEQIAKKLLKIAKEQGDKIKEAHYNRMLNIIITLENELIDTQHIMPKVGEVPIRNLVLKGGGPKGLAFIGALEEFEKLQQEYNLGELERIAGTSAGAITAALLAVGYRAGELKEKLSKLSLTDLLDNLDKEILLKLAKEQQKISELFKQKKEGKLLMLELINLLGTEKGLCRGEFFEKLMNSWIKEKTGKDNFTFGDLAEKVRKGEKGYKELYIVSLDILAKKEEDKLVIFNTEIEDYKDVRIADAVRASMSIPIVFKPKVIKYRDMQTGDYKVHECVDGGLLWNYPIDIFDKVKFRHTGLRGRGEEKPIYNEYTLGFSLYTPKKYQLEKDEGLNKAGINIKKEASVETMGSKILKGGFKFLFKAFTKERFEDIEKHLKEIKDEVIAKLAALLLNGEAITGTYWKESTEIRTIDISNCGVELLDFDLKEEKKQELIDAGKEAVREKFAKSKKRKLELETDEKSPKKAKKENTSLSSAIMSSEKEIEDNMEIDNVNTNSQINVAPEVLNLIIRDSQQSETLGKSPEL